jgi:uncharacterized protein YndB with AHSA1/START domain
MNMRTTVLIIAALLLCPPLFAERAIEKEIVIDAPLAQVWKAWTTPEELNRWFGADSKIDLRPGGAYEIYFDPKEKIGCNGCIVLAVQPERMLSFTWNAPPHLSEVRPHFTHVTVRLADVDENRTRVHFRQDGWGEGGQWDETFRYFERAWLEVVLPNLQKRFAKAD